MHIALCNRNPDSHMGGDNIQVFGYKSALEGLGHQVDFHWELFPNLKGYDYAILTHATMGWTDRQYQSVVAADLLFTLVAVFYPGVYSDTTPDRVREMCRKANRIVCFSRNEQDEMIAELGLQDITYKFVVVPNGVDKRIFSKGGETAPFSGFVMSAGRCDRLKQFHLVVKACKNLGLPVVIAASKWDDGYRDELKAEWDKATILDQMGQEELAKWYRSSTAYVCASAGERDNLCILEAAACGSSVVNTNYNRGRLNLTAPSVDPGNAEALQDAISTAYNSSVDYSGEVKDWRDIVRKIL